MNTELAKTISTCAVWLSVACILTFGLFRLNATGDIIAILVFFCLPALIVGGAVKATMEIWKAPAISREPQPSAPGADPLVGSRP